MNFHGLASLFLSLASFPLGVFVYMKGKNKPPNVTYALMAFATSLWCFAQYMGEISPNSVTALFWTRVNLVGGTLVLVFFVHFVCVFLKIFDSRKWAVISTYILGGLFILADATPLLVSDVKPRLIFRFYPVPGTVYPLFTAFFFLTIGYGIFELLSALKREKGVFRNQIIYVTLSSAISFLGASTLFFPVFGINIIPVGYYFVPLYILLGVYAIVKHRLLDITVVIRRGLVYSIMALLLSVLYVGAIFVFGELFASLTGARSIVSTIIVLFVFAAVFNPLRERLQTMVDRLFFKSRYDFQRTVRELSGAAAFILDLDELLEDALDKVVGVVKTDRGAFFLTGEHGRFELRRGMNIAEGLSPRSLPALLKERRKAVFSDEPSDLEAAAEMRYLQSEIAVPLLVKNDLIGFLTLGKKLLGDDYSDEDIDLLMTLGNHLAVAIENATLHEEILGKERELFRADKLASLGALSAGMAHEIKNPLAVLKGMAQSIPENLGDMDHIKKLSDVIPRQIDRINDIVEGLISFSKPKEARLAEVDVNSLLRDSIKFVEEEIRKNKIALRAELDDGIPMVMADGELLLQAFLNLLLNGIQAMKEGGKLKVKSSKFQNNKILIEISDTGRGISQEDLARIFDPFFTTKEKGAGLGLAVTHRIIKEHGGSINVESEMGKGTKFKVIL